MIKRFSALALTLVLSCLAALPASAARQPDPKTMTGDIRWASASMGSTGQVLLTGVTTIVRKAAPKLRLSVMTTSGSIENPRLMESKECDFAAVNSDAAYPAIKGTKPYDKPITMQTLFRTFGNTVIFIVPKNSPIQKMEDLEGKRVSVGPPNSGGYNLAFSVLTHGYDLWGKIKPVYLSYNDIGAALRDGTIDASMAHLNNSIPTSYLSEIDATMDVRAIGYTKEALDRIIAAEPFQTSDILKAGVLKNQKEDLITMTNNNIQYARPGIPDDLVYVIVKSLFENADQLGAFHQLGKDFTVKNALFGVLKDIPVHPGAARYYKEVGVWRDDLKIAE